VSQKITKFITWKFLLSKQNLENKCDTFIKNVKYYICQYGQENIYNSDQNSFQLEFHSGCTLAHKSVKKIETVIQYLYQQRRTLHYITDYFR